MEMDLGALQWVADELGLVSDRLVRALLGFADDPADTGRLRDGLASAHQIHATLRLLAVPSAEGLAGEIERIVQAMLEGHIAPSSDALQILLAAVMELPAYLRRVGSERRESPHDVLAVRNDLRLLRGAEALPAPPIDLTLVLDAVLQGTGDAAAEASEDEVRLLRLARQRFQAELIGILRNDSSEARLALLVRVFALLGRRLGCVGHRLFWEIAAAWVDALQNGGLPLDGQALALLRALDGELREATTLAAACYRRAPDLPLCTSLLEALAASAPVSERVAEAQRRHHLLMAPVKRHDLGAAGAAMTALADDLGTVLQRFELSDGDAGSSAGVLQDMAPDLVRIAQLLAGLGFDEEHRLLQAQIDRIAAGFTHDATLEEQLTAVSVALLDLDQRLATRAVSAGGGGSAAARRHPLQRALEAVSREVGDELGRIKQTISDYLSTFGGAGVLAQLPGALHPLVGVLRIAGLTAAADALAACREHLVEVSAGEREAPDARSIDTLADALGAVEYFLERFVIDGYASNLILARAVDALRGLDAPEARQLAEEEDLSVLAELGEEAEEAVSSPADESVEAAPTGVPSAAELSDPEIAGIFVEEATEVLETIDRELPQWRAQPEPGAALTELRRAFHTLKGSGRMVGATLLSELAWGVENLLNRILEGILTSTPRIIAVVGEARELLPELLAAFTGGSESGHGAVTALQARLAALARGEEPVAEQSTSDESQPAIAPVVDQEADRGLLAIFCAELGEHLHALRRYLEAPRGGVVTQSLLRTLHTLRGSSSAARSDALTLVMEPLDDMVHAAGEAGQALDRPRLELLSGLCELLEQAQLEPLEDGALLAAADALRVRIDALRPRPGRLVSRDTGILHDASDALQQAVSLLGEWRVARDVPEAGGAFVAQVRTVHELAIRHAVGALQGITQPLLEVLDANPENPADELFGLLGDTCEAGLDVLDRLAAGELPDTTPRLIERLAGHVRTREEPAIVERQTAGEAADALIERIRGDLQHAEPELLGIFLEEADELMISIDEAIDAWRKAPGHRAPFDDLQRHLHTLKGGARMAGLRHLGELSHDFETLLINEAFHFDAVDDAFLRRVDAFHQHLSRAVDTLRTREPSPGARPVPEPVVAAPELVPEARPTVVEAATVRQGASPPPPATAKPRAEVVRVAAQLLEELVNLAGEVSISRSRVEEQVSELAQQFDDMQMAIERVQSQVRQLDIATEAQVLFRRERAEGSFAEGFDPLEMDRYSQLQQLSRSLVESASDLFDIKRTLTEKTRDLETVLLHQARLNNQLQEGLMRSRMVPFQSVVPRFRRLVRQVAAELGKQVELVTGNIEGNLDRGILERVMAPLEHMLRNAVDHGIETAALRQERGKAAIGQVRIDVVRDGGDVLITVIDDGAGIDLGAVRNKALERGLLAPDARLSEHDVLQFILHPGFSTATTVTQISGRGVGMDVVNSEIRQMGGSLEIDSQLGVGTRFVVRLPFTVSVNRALLVSTGQESYALPLNTIAGVVRVSAEDLARHVSAGEPFAYADQEYPVRRLAEVLHPGERRGHGIVGRDMIPLVLVHGGGQTLAVEVDQLLGARDIAVKSLGPQFGAVPGLSGATVLGDGSVVLILDLPAMLRADVARGGSVYEPVERPLPQRQAVRPPQIMVVDDSVTVRKVTTRFLEREGMQVVTAKDGADAMLKLQQQQPDVMLLDIEMPHMDGFEVISKVRLSETMHGLPIIMITSRSGEKHRERAFALGANAYLGKPYQESVLLEEIRMLLPAREVKA